VAVLITFVSRPHFELATVDVKSILRGGWLAAKLTTMHRVNIGHCLIKMLFRFTG
jgi:hypothetical protein